MAQDYNMLGNPTRLNQFGLPFLKRMEVNGESGLLSKHECKALIVKNNGIAVMLVLVS